MKKCAYIRSDENNPCPMGLPISQACQNAGESVSHMCPLSMIDEAKKDIIRKANLRVYIYYKTGNRCLYAANVMVEKQATNCDFGDNAAGMHMPAPSGSPLYAQTFAGCGLDGLYAFPMGFYSDNNQSRNLFEGLFSLIGAENFEIIKNAQIPQNIIDKLEDNKSLTTEERQELESIIGNLRNEFEENRDDPPKAIELANKWFFTNKK